METTFTWEEELGRNETEAISAFYALARNNESEKWTTKSKSEALAAMARLQKEQPWAEFTLEVGTDYRIEGETGQWEFKTHQVVRHKDGHRHILYDTRNNLPKQRGAGRLRSSGAKELMLFFGLGRRTTRESANLLNRIRHQQDAVAPSTIRDFAESEGLAISTALANTTAAVLKEWERPQNALAEESPTLSADDAEAVLKDAFIRAEIPPDLEREVKSNPIPFTPPEDTVYVAPDGVFCKKQKEHRKKALSGNDKDDNARKTVSTCVATVVYQGHRIAVLAQQYLPLVWHVVAVLVANKLLRKHCCLLSDGERKLRDTFLPVLVSIFGSLHHVLDWHHLERRIAQMLSLAIKGKDRRNAHREKMCYFLWYGCTNSAIEYLKTIPPVDIKNKKHLDELADYLLRRSDQIPVYAVRKQLGLSNSSNSVEKANDRLVSSRQKNNGMSWSQQGSSSLAAIRMVMYNKQQEIWIRRRSISLKFGMKAA